MLTGENVVHVRQRIYENSSSMYLAELDYDPKITLKFKSIKKK